MINITLLAIFTVLKCSYFAIKSDEEESRTNSPQSIHSITTEEDNASNHLEEFPGTERMKDEAKNMPYTLGG